MSEILLAAEIPLRCLHGDMPEQELNLLQLATAVVAQLRAGSPQIVRRDVLQPYSLATTLHYVPDHILRKAFPPYLSRPSNCAKYSSLPGVPLSCLSVSDCSRTIPRRTHRQPPLPHLPNPLVSGVQNVLLPWSSSNDFLYLLLGNPPPGAHSLTLPNQASMPLSTARASAPTAGVSPLTEIHLNPPLTFLNHPHLITSSDLLTLSSTSFTRPPNQPIPRINRESRMQNPYLPRVRRVSGFVQIPLSQVPRRDALGSTPMSRAGALVDRVLSTGHPVGVVV
jgi:hypothetical protein